MSGIFGIVHGRVAVSEHDLAAMAVPMGHRGPDGIEHQVRDNVGLGHAMLHTTPESLHETLPFWDPSAGLAITADARLDNREELLASVRPEAAPNELISDSQLILLAYRKWGEVCVEHLLGDFAFAIWNQISKSLFCARDHIGCKPFYYHHCNDLTAFASSALGVAQVPAVGATLNEGRVADLLVYELEGINNTCTFYNEILRLPPASILVCDQAGLRIQQYWRLEPEQELHFETDADCLEAFKEVYSEAVRCRLRSHREPAATLSGGLDSSTIVALARDMLKEQNRPPLKTFSGIADDVTDCIESNGSMAVARQGGLNAQWIRPAEIATHGLGFQQVLEHLEDPFDTYMGLLTISGQLAAAGGSRVMLDGLDGDIVAGLSDRYITELLREGKWRLAWREARGLSQHTYRGYHSGTRIMLEAVRSFLTPDALRASKRLWGAGRRYRRCLEDRPIATTFASRVGLADRVKEWEAGLFGSANSIGATESLPSIHAPFLTAAVERYERLGSYHGVEARHPLMDKRVVQFCARLPREYKTRDGWTKFLLRLFAVECLPNSVAWREGVGIELGWEFNKRMLGESLGEAQYQLAEIASVMQGFLAPELLSSMVHGKIADVGADDNPVLWEVYSLLRYLERAKLTT